MKNYFLRHLQVFFYTLGQLARTPLASLMTIAVIGISLALPAGLYLLIDNVQRMTVGWDGKPQVSVFLKLQSSEQQAQSLQRQLRGLTGVEHVEYISAAQALAEFKRLSGFGDSLKALPNNPLPPVLVIKPKKSHADPERLQAMVASVRQSSSAIDLVQLDLEWVKRLYLVLQLAERGLWLLALLLGMAVLLTTGNTIRLAILNRRQEIEISTLIGATNAFIRRPFLYSGLLQGLLGALMAWLLLHLGLLLIAGPTRQLAALYQNAFSLHGLGWTASGGLLLAGALLGWVGARVAVARHLHELKPT